MPVGELRPVQVCPTKWSTRLSRFLVPLTRHEWHQCTALLWAGPRHMNGHRCRCGAVCPWVMNLGGTTDA